MYRYLYCFRKNVVLAKLTRKKMAIIAPNKVSSEAYLALERQLEERHEYENGKIIPLGGASLTHVRIVRNLLLALSKHSIT